MQPALIAAVAVCIVAPGASPPAGGPSPEAARPAGAASDRLLVVAPESFRDSLRAFVADRGAQLGAPVAFVALEEIVGKAAQDGDRARPDAPELLKREFYRRWKAGEISAVLLVGDVDVMPIRFMTLDRVAAPAFDTAFYPCDLYYADLARDDGSFDDWNAAKDGVDARYIGQVRGEKNKDGPVNYDRVSYAPEIAVGRWPVSTAEEARAVADKTLRHQRAVLDRASRRTAARDEIDFFVSGGWIDNSARVTALIERVKALGAWRPDLHAFFTAGREPTVSAVSAALARSPAAIFHTGHGQPWGWEGCFDRDTMAKSPATETPPVLFSIGCSTAVIATQPPYEAYVDVDGNEQKGTNAGQVFTDFPPPPAPIQRGAHNATSVSEEAVRRADGGAIAVIGCVTGSQPCAHTLLDGFVDAMQQAPAASVGRWWTSALSRYVRDEKLMELVPAADWYPPSIFFQGMKFVYLGDPTVRLR